MRCLLHGRLYGNRYHQPFRQSHRGQENNVREQISVVYRLFNGLASRIGRLVDHPCQGRGMIPDGLEAIVTITCA
jgi:hypothetical protein